MFRKILLSIAIIGAAVSANAQLKLGQPAYGGTGCPAGTASVTVAPGDESISILFDQFVAEAGRTTSRMIDRKNCNISIPVQVPQGYSVAIFTIDYRGFIAVPNGGSVRLDSEYFWAGSRGPIMTRTADGPLNQNYILTDKLQADSLVWAPCGASVNLRVNASVMARSNRAMEQTIATVDSADLSSALIYHLQWKRCQ